MRKHRSICVVLVIILLTVCAVTAFAENVTEEEEQGYSEIKPLLEMTEMNETEGMSLEEITEAFAESAMSEYVDSTTGFSMQYPSIFMFDEESAEPFAYTADGKATLFMEHMINDGALDENKLEDAIRLEIPDAEIVRNEQNSCLRFDRLTDEEKNRQTDLYFLTPKSLHHIVMKYPEDEKGTYFSYIEYMINTMETNETDQG